MKRVLIFSVTLAFVVLSSVSLAERDGTCNLKSGGVAHYHCPDGYDVIIAGDGTDECDGECYKRENKADLERAISFIVGRRMAPSYPSLKWELGQGELGQAADAIMQNKCADLKQTKWGSLRVCPGGSQ